MRPRDLSHGWEEEIKEGAKIINGIVEIKRKGERHFVVISGWMEVSYQSTDAVFTACPSEGACSFPGIESTRP